MSMTNTRMLTHNVYYFVASGLATDWSTVNIIANAPNDITALTLPTVAIVPERAVEEPLEIGTNTQIRTSTYIIQCYCKTDGQRDDLGDFLMNLFSENSVDFLDYNDGFPPTTGQSILGKINFEFINMNPVKILGSPHPAEKHRMDIRMSTEVIGL